MSRGPVQRLRDLWGRLGGSAGGRWLFARLFGRIVPYSGTIGARVVELAPGHAKVVMADRRRVRNHLRSVHAVALTNLGEMATGLAFNVSLPPGAKAIVTGLETEYLKKARGTMTATCDCEAPAADAERDYDVVGEIRDEAGDLVARVTAVWRVRPG
jgi:acyl-coenzyme A thioesterase PaaI-like protein